MLDATYNHNSRYNLSISYREAAGPVLELVMKK